MGEAFTIRKNPLCMAGIGLIALAVAIATDDFLYPGYARIVFFSAVMSMLIVYSSFDMLRIASISIFIVVDVALHLALCCVRALSDDAYYGVLLTPVAILDYIGSLYIVYQLYRRHNNVER